MEWQLENDTMEEEKLKERWGEVMRFGQTDGVRRVWLAAGLAEMVRRTWLRGERGHGGDGASIAQG